MITASKRQARQNIIAYFRQVAQQKNAENKVVQFESLLDTNDSGRRILYVMPESLGDVFLSTSLFRSIKELYPEYNLYVATKPENFPMLEGNPHVFRVLPYMPQMDSQLWLIGQGGHKGFFEIAFLPFVITQRHLTYLQNGQDKIAYSDLRY